MGDAAQGEPISHEVFEKPLKVTPEFEFWKTPKNYRRYPGGETLPDRIKVWRVQNTGKGYGGVVARSWGFNDSPDAEVLTPGFNSGKEHGAVGVGRHGNFLQWGFSAPPSKMTDAGRRFFINSICYISRFYGKAPLVRAQSSDRFNGVALIKSVLGRSGNNRYSSYFPAEYLKRFGRDADGMFDFYMDHYELIYQDGNQYKIDMELKGLGVSSNRTVETLDSLVAMFDQPEKAATVRKVLARYTLERFESAGEWRRWLEKNRDSIYFSDRGGYKFRVIPHGYLSPTGTADQ